MSKNIAKATGVILIVNLAVKILGFLRETFIANGFGASWYTDAYLVAYTLPYFLQAILGAALVTAVVPALTRYWVAGDDEEANRVGSSLLNLTALLLTVLTLLGIWATPALVFLTAPNLPPEAAALAVDLARIMFPSVIFMGVGMVVNGILNSRYHFAAGAFAPGMSNIIIICGVVFFTSAGIYGLAWATLISFIGFLLIQLPDLFRCGFRYRLCCDWRHPAVKRVAADILPIVLGVAVNQIYFALNRVFASGLSEGSISALNYASKLMNLPIGIFVAAVASAIYPALAENALNKDDKALSRTMGQGLSMVCLVAVPAAVGLMVLRVPIVQLLFQRGAFDANDTQITAYALLFFSLGLLPMALNMVLTRAYYSLNDVKTPVVMGLLSIVANLAVSFLLIKPLGHGGLALANSLASLANAYLLYRGLGKRLPSLRQTGFARSLVRIIGASLVMGVAAGGAMFLLEQVGVGSTVWLAVRVAGAVGVGCAVYVAAASLLRVEALTNFWQVLRKKLAK